MLSLALLGLVMASAVGETPANLNDVSMEVAVLQTLHDLELTVGQLSKLSELARASAPKGESRQPAKTSPEIATALKNLHAAYAKGDDKQISECREKLDDLMEDKKQQPELDNSVTITEEAKAKAAEALKLLNVRQTGAFLATLELTDPTELLHSALEQVREIKNTKDLEQEITSVAEEVTWLLHGLEEDEDSQKTKDQVTKLLQRASQRKKASGNDSKSLKTEAADIVKEVDNTVVIGHILEHGVAEMLSNPRLEAAIRIQSRAAAKPATLKKPGSPSATPKK